MQWLQRFFYGRHGSDALNVALLVFALIITLVCQIFGLGWISLISYIPLALCVFRMFSRNNEKRWKENAAFMRVLTPIAAPFKKAYHRIRESKTYRFFKCPKCKTSLRVPKGKGHITITCPKCGEKFDKTV